MDRTAIQKMKNSVREILNRLCATLNKHSVDYLIVGGIAVAVHGYERRSYSYSGTVEEKFDVDIWYDPTVENFTALVSALEELGIDSTELRHIIFDRHKTFLKIPFDDMNFKADFLCQLKGLSSYRDCRKRAKMLTLDGHVIPFIGLNDLILNKESVNRPGDEMDIRALKGRNKLTED